MTSSISWSITYAHLREIRVTDSAPCTPSSPPSFPRSSPIPTDEPFDESYSTSTSPIYRNGDNKDHLVGKVRRPEERSWKVDKEYEASGIEMKNLPVARNVLSEASSNDFSVNVYDTNTFEDENANKDNSIMPNLTNNDEDFKYKNVLTLKNILTNMNNIPTENSSSNSSQKHSIEKSNFLYKEKGPHFLEFEETPQSSRHPSDAIPMMKKIELKIPDEVLDPHFISINVRVDDHGNNNSNNTNKNGNENNNSNNDNNNDNNYYNDDNNNSNDNDNDNNNYDNNYDHDNNDDNTNSNYNNNSNTEVFVVQTLTPWKILLDLLKSRTFWRFSAFTLILINLKAIFRHLDATLPTYLVRTFGQNVPKGIIYSINPFIIMFLTPLISALTGGYAHYDMIKWGSYLTAASPFFLAFSTSIWASIW